MCLTLGSGDSDNFSFDANTALPTSYYASVNGVSKSTMITNNTNRTIRQVAVTDGLFSGGSQTCTSGYDDLGRLGYSNCLPLWFASYSYDPFGNIDKSDQGYSGTSFLPTYNQATNRFQALPAPPQPTYDGNGNLTYDGFHNYTWDAEGNMLSMDGSPNSTFDAFNRRVEYGSGSSYTQLLYPPFDETYQLGTWGATPSMRMPLPGGGQAIFNTSGLNNYRHPNWQGSQTLASSPTRTMLVDNAFTPFGEKYAEYNGGYNGYFADMLAIGPNGLIADGYQSETRMLHGSQGRWVSPDPAGLGAVDPTNPQSWNRYAYVGNDPLNHVDPSGMQQSATGGYNPPAPCPAGTSWNGDQCVVSTTTINFSTCALLDNPDFLCGSAGQNSFATAVLGFNSGGASAPSKVGMQPLYPTKFRVALPFWQAPLPKYCGPGSGSGDPVNQVDDKCHEHDLCYQNKGVTGADIFNPLRSPEKTAAINYCDAQLCKRLAAIIPDTRTENGDAFFVGLFFSLTHGSISACIP